MNTLPIVHRELLVASKKRGTWWIRLLAVIGALAVVGIPLAFSAIGPGTMTGTGVFFALAWMIFVYCILAGLMFTSDAISEETREGTLGLLFLTDLNGRNVVFGKMASCALRSLYGLLAIVPVLGVPLMLGGVSGNMFFGAVLALLNMLFVSTTLCLAVSATTQSSGKSLMISLGIVALLLMGWLPGCLWIFALLMGWRVPTTLNLKNALTQLVVVALAIVNFAALIWLCHVWFGPWQFYTFSPATSLSLASRDIPVTDTRYLASLLTVHGFGWIFLWLAARRTASIWREVNEDTEERSSRQEAFPASKYRALIRARFDNNPSGRLLQPKRWMLSIIWIGAILVGLQSGTTMLGISGSNMALLPLVLAPAGFASLAMRLILTLLASQVFSRGRRDGSLELLLVTPLPRLEILKGIQKALAGIYWRPFILICVLNTVLGLVGAGILFYESSNLPGYSYWSQFAQILLAPFVFILEFLALVWMSFWLAWKLKRPGLTPVLAWVFGELIPGFLFGILFSLLMIPLMIAGGLNTGFSGNGLFTLGTYGISLLTPYLVYRFARSRLNKTFLAGETPRPVGSQVQPRSEQPPPLPGKRV